VGYLGRGEGLVVHTCDCSIGKRLLERDNERWLAVEWAEQPKRAFETSIALLVRNGKGVLAEVAQAVSGAEADIAHVDMEPVGAGDGGNTTELRLLLAVRDRQHLADVLRALRRCSTVIKVARARPS
jgi:GTP pyrophosphokinase/guanosine-3',5'-bis(diphosphate) 3'-pyrophosphohydrolase